MLLCVVVAVRLSMHHTDNYPFAGGKRPCLKEAPSGQKIHTSRMQERHPFACEANGLLSKRRQVSENPHISTPICRAGKRVSLQEARCGTKWREMAYAQRGAKWAKMRPSKGLFSCRRDVAADFARKCCARAGTGCTAPSKIPQGDLTFRKGLARNGGKWPPLKEAPSGDFRAKNAAWQPGALHPQQSVCKYGDPRFRS